MGLKQIKPMFGSDHPCFNHFTVVTFMAQPRSCALLSLLKLVQCCCVLSLNPMSTCTLRLHVSLGDSLCVPLHSCYELCSTTCPKKKHGANFPNFSVSIRHDLNALHARNNECSGLQQCTRNPTSAPSLQIVTSSVNFIPNSLSGYFSSSSSASASISSLSSNGNGGGGSSSSSKTTSGTSGNCLSTRKVFSLLETITTGHRENRRCNEAQNI